MAAALGVMGACGGSSSGGAPGTEASRDAAVEGGGGAPVEGADARAEGGRAGADASSVGGAGGGVGAGGSRGGDASAGGPDAGRLPDASGAGPDAVADVSPDAGPLLAVHFVDVTREAGIDHVQTLTRACSIPSRSCDPESPGFTGGAAVGDIDGDGHDDLYVTRFDGPDLLYRNRGDGTFEEVAAAAGLTLPIRTNGAGLCDIDNDGDRDLLVMAIGDVRHYLFVNDGSGHFTEEASSRGADVLPGELHQGTSVAFGDYDVDGWPDAFVGEWRPSYLFEGTVPPSNARLLRNRGAAEPGHFDDVTDAAGVAMDGLSADGVFAYSPSFSDVDDDGLPDLVVSADFGTSRLFWNDGDGTFTDGTVAAGVGTDENGMGSAIGDYDGDGRLDWFVTSIYDAARTCDVEQCNWGYTGNRLYRGLGGRRFEDQTDVAGVRDGGWGWGTTFLDYDNDGDLDLVMTNGIYFRASEREDAFNDQPMRLWRNDGGSFEEVAFASGLRDRDDGKGLVTFDYDEDGDLDLFVANNGAAPRLYRNEGGNTQGFLRLRVQGVASNRDGFGTKVWLRRTSAAAPVVRELRGGTNYLGQNEPVLHFGLGAGAQPVAEVRVRWPSGRETLLVDVAPNQTVALVEPTGDP